MASANVQFILADLCDFDRSHAQGQNLSLPHWHQEDGRQIDGSPDDPLTFSSALRLVALARRPPAAPAHDSIEGPEIRSRSPIGEEPRRLNSHTLLC
jgi:hypothetical protein